MQLIEPSATLFMEKDLVKKIERCYRICYKSEHHIKEGSEKFLAGLIHHTEGNPHWSPLEHARIRLKLDILSFECLRGWQEDRGTSFIRFNNRDNCTITANFRSLQEFIKYRSNDRGFILIQAKVAEALARAYPIIFSVDDVQRLKETADSIQHYVSFRYCETTCEVLGEANDYATFHIITTRDVLQEFARHRSLSFSVESTRYCNYQKKGMVFTVPRPYEWSEEVIKEINKPEDDETQCLTTPEAMMFFSACFQAELNYNYLIGNKVQPQVARMILPGALKTEMIVTGTFDAWQHFMDLRCDSNAHPQIRFIADQIKRELSPYFNCSSSE